MIRLFMSVIQWNYQGKMDSLMIRYRIKLTIRNTCSAHPQRGSSMGLGTVPTSKRRQSLAVDIACTVELISYCKKRVLKEKRANSLRKVKCILFFEIFISLINENCGSGNMLNSAVKIEEFIFVTSLTTSFEYCFSLINSFRLQWFRESSTFCKYWRYWITDP